MTWWLTWRHLREPTILPLAAVLVFPLVIEPGFLGAITFGMLAVMLPRLIPASESAFESALPLAPGVAARARLFAALLVVALVLLVAWTASLFMGKVLIASPSRAIALAAIPAALTVWYLRASVIASLILTHPRVLPASSHTPSSSDGLHHVATAAAQPHHVRLSADPRSGWHAWWPVLRLATPWRIFPTVALSGFMGASHLAPFMIVVLFQSLDMPRDRLGVMHSLPISSVMRVLVRPGVPFALCLALWAIGFTVVELSPHAASAIGLDARQEPWSNGPHRGTARTFESPTRAPDDPVRVTRGDPWRNTTAPLALWQRTPRGSAPVLRAPWGEEVVADTLTLLGLTLYNPYTVRVGNSDPFATWQFNKLSEQHFGVRVTRAEFETTDNRELPLPLTQRWPVQVLVAALIFAYAALGLWAYECTRSHRVSRGSMAPALARAWLPVMLWFGAAGIPFVLTMRLSFSRGGALVTSVLETSMLRVAEVLPGWLVPIVALLVVGVAFLPVVWQSRRSEPDWTELHRLPTPWRV